MEICADCGKTIGMGVPSYYKRDAGDDFGKTYHSHCGDAFGINAKNAEIEQQATFIEFVFRWVMDEKMTAAEVVGILKHHPYLQDMLAARASLTAGERGK